MQTTIINREVGVLPISIGTSRAIEALLGLNEEYAPRKADLNRLRELWLNIPTLIRNLHQAIPTAEFASAPVDVAAFLVLEEVKLIREQLAIKFGAEFKVVCYSDNAEELHWRYPNATWIKPTTAKQLYRTKFEETVFKIVCRLLDDEGIYWLAVHRKPVVNTNVVVMLTHMPHQLLWSTWFADLYLLESYTGKLKPQGQWYTKLKHVRVEDRIPFTKFTLLFFGDGTLFNSQPIDLRNELLEIGITKRWTHISTDERLGLDIQQNGSNALQNCHAHLLSRSVAV